MLFITLEDSTDIELVVAFLLNIFYFIFVDRSDSMETKIN